MIELNPNGLTIVQLTSEVKDRLPTIRHCCRVSQDGAVFWLHVCFLPKLFDSPLRVILPVRLTEAQIKGALGTYAK
jgi:hypothetical protein